MYKTEATPSSRINYPVENLEIISLKKAYITRSMFVGTVLGGIHNASLPHNLPPYLKRRFNVVFFGSLIKNKLTSLPDENYFFVMNLWGNGYHHWLSEVAPKFFLFESEIKNGTLLFPEPLPHYIKEFLEIFGFTNYKIYKGNCFVKRVSVITNPNSGHYNKNHLANLKSRILTSISDNLPEKHEKIYVSRKNATKRKVVNEEEVMEFLKKRGFFCVELENKSFAEQVNLFRHCKTFISIHGAALTNVLFMPKGGKVVELFPEKPPESDLNACYYRLAPVLGQHHTFVWCKRQNPQSDFHLDTDNVFVNVSELLEGVD